MFGLPRVGCGQWPEEAAEADEEKRGRGDSISDCWRRQRDRTELSLFKLRTAVMLSDGHCGGAPPYRPEARSTAFKASRGSSAFLLQQTD